MLNKKALLTVEHRAAAADAVLRACLYADKTPEQIINLVNVAHTFLSQTDWRLEDLIKLRDRSMPSSKLILDAVIDAVEEVDE